MRPAQPLFVPSSTQLGTHQAISNIATIARRTAHSIRQIRRIHTAGVIRPDGPPNIAARLGQKLDEAVARARALNPILDHLQDAALGIGRVEGDAVVGLHDARVDDAVVGGGHAHVARALLHDDGEDDARVDVGGARDFLDGALHEADFLWRVVDLEGREIHGPEGVEVEPGGGVGEG